MHEKGDLENAMNFLVYCTALLQRCGSHLAFTTALLHTEVAWARSIADADSPPACMLPGHHREAHLHISPLAFTLSLYYCVPTTY